MDTSLGRIRSLALSLRAWNSSGTTFDGRVRDAVNAALQHLAKDVPTAFVPSEERVVLLAPVDTEATTVNALFQATADQWVLRITDSAGGALGASILTTWRPVVDGSWDGLMHLEVALPNAANSEEGRRQSREWWLADGFSYFVSLDRRWRNTTDANMLGRIYMKDFFTRADITKILDPVNIWDAGRNQAWSLSAGTVHRQRRQDFQRQSTGPPEDWWRSGQFQMPTPTEPPMATTNLGLPWIGPLPEGDFNFVYTYVWGRRDVEWQEGGNSGIRDPVWESAPSPEMTAVFSHSAGSNAGRAIILQAPNIDAMQNFFTAGGALGDTRHGRSGLRIRFYVRRAAIRASTGAVEFRNIETNERYYLLAEIDPTDTLVVGATTYYTALAWRGVEIPDITRQLIRSQGYYAWQVSPHQDRRYELDMRVLRRPTDLIDDQDTPPVQPDAWTVFLELVLYYLCLMDGVDAMNAQMHLKTYTDGLLDVRDTYGQTGKVVEAVPFGGDWSTSQYNYGRATDVP